MQATFQQTHTNIHTDQEIQVWLEHLWSVDHEVVMKKLNMATKSKRASHPQLKIVPVKRQCVSEVYQVIHLFAWV